LTVLRYVERNAMQANLVTRAEEWPWSSLHLRVKRRIPPYLSDGPVKRPRRWTTTVNTPIADEELEALRSSVNRGAPYGRTKWQRRTAARLGLESSLRPTGRPRTTERDITRK
jgi:putative transposase